MVMVDTLAVVDRLVLPEMTTVAVCCTAVV